MQSIYSIKLPAVSALGLQMYYNRDETVTPARTYPAHIHDGIEIYLLEEGEISFRTEQGVCRLSPGDAVFALPGEIHNCIQASPSRHKHCCIWLSAEVEELLLGYTRFSGKERHIKPSAEEGREILPLCRRLTAEIQRGDSLAVLCTLFSLLALLGGAPRTSQPKGLPERLQRMLADMEKHIAEIRGLSYFTEKYYISQSTLHRLFEKHLGLSPGRYLEGVRLSRARLLLRQGESVSAACTAAGFGDYSGFIRLFRERFGLTPLAYRRLNDGGAELQLYVNKES